MHMVTFSVNWCCSTNIRNNINLNCLDIQPMIALLAILRINQQHSCSIPFHMGVQQTPVEFTHPCHYYQIIHVNDGCQTNWIVKWPLADCKLCIWDWANRIMCKKTLLFISLSVILSNLIGYSYCFFLV
jgi:hypothetical protein